MLNYKEMPVPNAEEGMRLYIEHGVKPGSFLRSVLENDLVYAIAYADDTNIRFMKEYAEFLYWELPLNAWGSKEKVEKWINHQGLKGSKQKQHAETAP